MVGYKILYKAYTAYKISPALRRGWIFSDRHSSKRINLGG